MSWSQIAGFPPADYSTAPVFRAFAAGLPPIREALGPMPRAARDLVPILEALRSAGRSARLGSRTIAACVVTGQQPHWLGGPAFVLYKTASAISAARSLSRLAGSEVVPVFWSHSDDSDVSEVDHLHAVNPNWDVQRFSLGMPPGRTPLYSVALPPSSAAVMEAFGEALPGSEYRDELLARFASLPVTSLAEHFAACLRAFFGSAAPVIVEPRQFRDICTHTAIRYLEGIDRCDDIWRSIDAALQASQIPAPFDPWSAPPFFILAKDGSRIPVRRADEPGYLSVEGSPVLASELAEQLRADARALIPGTVLRVVAQSAILPAVAYIGGQAEIAYQIYALPLFPVFDLVPPALLPRLSATLMDEGMLPLLERFGVEHPLAVRAEELIESRPTPLDQPLGRILDALEAQIEERFGELAEQLEELDPSLPRSLRTTAQGMRGQVQKVRRKIDRVLRNRAGTGARQARKIANWLKPKGGLQERTVSALQLLARYGPDLPRELLELADPFTDTHRLFVNQRGSREGM